jgi:hypothetical protein
MHYIIYHKDVDCRAIISGCPYLNIGMNVMTERIKLISCNALHIVLQFRSKRISGSIGTEIDIIETPWECPYLQKLRKQGKYPSIQASIL